jgi:hypothetical protein
MIPPIPARPEAFQKQNPHPVAVRMRAAAAYLRD